ncbi:hypothetical protein C0995_015457 [Termitomyces sp. Mi166|nr:hypothetical protein C0995_015457 [Termitomyces sp. Mi166\
MYIASTITSTKSTHDISVLVLVSSDVEGTIHSRKLIARPSHYHDLVVAARKIFSLKNDATLVFGTSTLDVCRGAWVEIDESAYEPLLECLDEVIVKPGAPRQDVVNDEAVETAKGKTREIDSTPKGRQDLQLDASASAVGRSDTLTPSPHTRDELEARTRAEPPATKPSSSPLHPRSKFISKTELAPNVAPKTTKSRLLTRLDEMANKQKLKPLSNTRQHKPEPPLEPKPEPERAALEVEEKPKPKFRPASATREIKKEPEPEPVLRPEPPRTRQRKPQPKPEPAVEDEEPGEKDEDDPEPPSSAKTEEASDTGRKDDAENEDDNFWRFGTQSVGPSSGASRQQQESVPQPTNPPLNSKLTRMGTTIHVEVKEMEEKRKIKDARARLSTVNATQLPRASERDLAHFDQDPDVRFMVTVLGPRTAQGADFRTRGGHKIKKVLESVCRTFKLPSERSRLVLEDDSREVKQYYCDPEDTVGLCGIDADSRLLVQVDGMSGEELSKYGEEEEDED